MPREQIRALADDVDRLLAAGAATAPNDEKLRRREQALRELGRQVPVLAKVADAVQRVLEAPAPKATAPLLDLLSIVRQVRAGLTTAGVEGELAPAEPSGPWATATPARDVYPVVEALARSGQGRVEVLDDALRRGVVADLRLVEPLLAGLGDSHGEFADRVAEQALPAFGAAVLPELRRDLAISPKAKTIEVRRLASICRIDPQEGAALCRAALDRGSNALRVQALTGLAEIEPAEAERRALELLAGKPAREVRDAALMALQGSKSDAALEALVAATAVQAEDWSTWRAAVSALKVLPHPRVHQRLVQELETAAARAKSAATAKAKKSKQAPKPKGKTPAPAPDDADPARALQHATRLVDALQQRGDRRAVAAIVPLLEHPASDLREAAINALIELDDPKGLEAAAGLVNDPKVWEEAARAAWKLSAGPRYESLAPLCEAYLAADPKKARQERGAFVIEDLFSEEAAAEPPRADWDPRWAALFSKHLDGPQRAHAALALAVVQGAAAVPALLRILEPSVKKDECGVVEGLGFLRAREAIEPMLALMPGQKPNHYCIHDALRQIGDPTIVPKLKAILGKTKDSMRKWRLTQLITDLEAQASP